MKRFSARAIYWLILPCTGFFNISAQVDQTTPQSQTQSTHNSHFKQNRWPHIPEESSYFDSRNFTLFPRAHSTKEEINRDQFHAYLYRDLEYEPFVTTRMMTGFLGQQVYLMPTNSVTDANCADVDARPTIQLTYWHALAAEFVQLPKTKRTNIYADFIVEYYGPVGYNLIAAQAINQGISGAGGLALIYGAIYLDWEKTSLTFGRAWNPWVDPEIQVSNQRVTTIGCVSETLTRDYQIRLMQEVTPNIDLIFAVLGFLDDKITSNDNGFINQDHFLFNVPQLDFHMQCRAYQGDNIYAAGFNIQSEKPAKFDNFDLFFGDDPAPFHRTNVFKTQARVTAISGFLFGKLVSEYCTFRAKALYGSNIVNEMGGYAVSARTTCHDDQGCRIPPHTQYLPLRIAEVVADVQIPIACDGNLETGLFFSYFKNYGASQPIFKLDLNIYPNQTGNSQFLIFSINRDLDYLFTVSPRIKFHAGAFSVCGEIEYYRAAYGSVNDYGAIGCSCPQDNLRFIFSAQCIF